jgi:ABC-type antimicrobial peptide transport system permease subunit
MTQVWLPSSLGNLLGGAGPWGGAIEPLFSPQLLAQALRVAMGAGVAGGFYPAWRATRMQPVEALRYE